jgi:hypothetical protein
MGDDPQILEYEDEILHASDLCSLGDGCWLTDPVISFYLAFVHKEVMGSTQAVLPMPPSMVFLLIHSDPGTVAEVVAPLKLVEVNEPFLLSDQAASRPHLTTVGGCFGPARAHRHAPERQRRRLAR